MLIFTFTPVMDIDNMDMDEIVKYFSCIDLTNIDALLTTIETFTEIIQESMHSRHDVPADVRIWIDKLCVIVGELAESKELSFDHGDSENV